MNSAIKCSAAYGVNLVGLARTADVKIGVAIVVPISHSADLKSEGYVSIIAEKCRLYLVTRGDRRDTSGHAGVDISAPDFIV